MARKPLNASEAVQQRPAESAHAVDAQDAFSMTKHNTSLVIPFHQGNLQKGNSYEAVAKAVLETGNVIDLLPVPYDWEEEPDYFVGRYINTTEVVIQETAFRVYTFDTDSGLRCTSLGCVVDNTADVFRPNSIYLIKRLADKMSGNGKSYHQYRIILIQECGVK